MADSSSREGARYSNSAVLEYVARVHASHDASFARAFATPAFMPAIQVGPSEGRLLYLLMKLMSAKRVVEVGTLAGYSAMHIARALPDDGHLWSVEYDRKHAVVARENLEAAGLGSRVSVEVGAGRDVLPTLEKHGPFDAVFIDADKGNYDHYGTWAIANLRVGGIVLGDNAYLFGKLTEDSEAGRAMRKFHELVAAACESVCIPTPDGVVLGIKR
jgi:predicted O-methyltransferase YrrM